MGETKTIQCKHITDLQVIKAHCHEMDNRFPYEILACETGCPRKVAFRCCERACDRGFLDYGVSLRTAWLTERGRKLIEDSVDG